MTNKYLIDSSSFILYFYMNNTLFNQRSISTLLISVEALDLYNLNINNKSIIYNFTKTKNDIKLVYELYLLITQQQLQSTIKQILDDYCNDQNSQIIVKYIQRFTYIYNKYNYKNIFKLNTQKLAITELYFINQINRQNGFYKVLKYIYVYDSFSPTLVLL